MESIKQKQLQAFFKPDLCTSIFQHRNSEAINDKSFKANTETWDTGQRTVTKTQDYVEVHLSGLRLSSHPDHEDILPHPTPAPLREISNSLSQISGVGIRNVNFCMNDSISNSEAH